MTQLSLLEILRDQKSELDFYASTRFCERPEEKRIKLNSKKAQVVIGVRRSGKSTLCYNALSKSGVKYAYVNFDDERLARLTADDLNDVLRCLYQIYGAFTHLFLDEAQNIDGWHLFVNRLMRQGMKVVLTGSNAKLLSSELATHLSGRYNEIELYPFSFREFCDVKGVAVSDLDTKGDAMLRRAFDEYLRSGGFPEIVSGEEDPDQYIDALVGDILDRDIVNRFKIRYKDAFRTLAGHLMNTAPCEIIVSTLQSLFNFKTDHTVENYVDYLYQAYLMIQLKKYSPKSSIRVRNAKCYPVDVALMNARKGAMAKDDLGWRLEAVVFLELCRRYPAGYDIYYYKDGAFEVDFLVCHRAIVIEAVQVSYDISSAKTYAREINGLLKAKAVTKCEKLTLITAFEQGEASDDNREDIRIVPGYKWLAGLA